MERYLLPILASLTLAIVASHAALTAEVYWNSVLPNTPMPEVIKGMLQPAADFNDEKGTSVGVGKGGVGVSTGKGKPGTKVGVGKGGVAVNTGYKGKPQYATSGLFYGYVKHPSQLHDNPNKGLFFLEKELRAGMSLNLTKPTNQASFLPREVADLMPFSSKQLPAMLNSFSAKPESILEKMIKNTVLECEAGNIEGEDRYCARSLEAMVDFTISKLGTNVRTVSTDPIQKETQQRYTVTDDVKKMMGKDAVVCHRENYPYAVFYCHSTKTTKTFEVSLAGANRTKLRAAAVCHTDTSAWNPKHMAFQVLKVKPGTVPICHFLPEDHIVFVKS